MKTISRRLMLLLLAAVLLLTAGCKKSEPVPSSDENSGFRIGYAVEGVTIVDDADALQKEYDEMMEAAKEQGMALSYQNDAVSENGLDVDCYISNPIANAYDMFIAIYADEDFTDELYLSQLLRPGTAFNSIRLERRLDPGLHTVYVVYTQIVVEDNEQKIRDQNIVTLNLHVLGE